MKTTEQIQKLLKECESSPRIFFGLDIESKLSHVLRDCHPDRFKDEDKTIAEEIFKRFSSLADECRRPPVTIKTKLRSYVLGERIAVGDVSDVHLSTSGGEEFVVKTSRIGGSDALLKHEYFVLSELAEKAGDSAYKYYFPTPVETIKAKDGMLKQINVFARENGGYLLPEILAKYPKGLSGEHLAWFYKRLLTGIGFAHQHNWIHHAILPCHLVVFPGTHGVQLLDWKFASSSTVLKSIVAKYREWYPPEILKKHKTSAATDIYLATKCVVYLAGGDPVKNAIPDSVPRPMAGFFRAALLESQKQRPQDAWLYLGEFTAMLADLYGPPKFHSLAMS